MRLECGACIVREWQRDDETSLVRCANNYNVWRNLMDRFPNPYTEADARTWLSSLASEAEPTHWAIEVDALAVGGIGVDLDDGASEKSAHFGYWLAEPYWSRGIMTAAVGATAEYALTHFGLVRLEAPVFEWNPASMRVLEKCGFVRERVLRRSVIKEGRLIDQVMYALVR